MQNPNIPPQQLSIANRCFHPSGDFAEFKKEEIEQSIPDRFEKQVRLYPDRLAVKSEYQELTYDQLNKIANRLAHTILAECGESLEPVAVLLNHGIQMVVALLGVLKARKLFVPIDASNSATRISGILQSSQQILIVTNDLNLSLANEVVPKGCKVITFEAIGESISDRNPILPVSPDDLAAIVYTSRSTGEPKGVMHSHRSLLHMAMIDTNSHHLCLEDRFSLIYPVNAISGLRDCLRALPNGAALYPFDVKNEGAVGLANWLRREEITSMRLPVSVFRQLISVLEGAENFPKLRLVHPGAETVYASDFDNFRERFSHDCIFTSSLGGSEINPFTVYFNDNDRDLTEKTVPMGYPEEGIEVLLLDDDRLEVGRGEVGEIAVKSRYLAEGYWNNPELTRTRFLPDPQGTGERIYLTGDLGRMHADGCLIHLGRKDFQVKIRGNTVILGEVEAAISELEAISAVTVVDLTEESGNTRLTAYVTLAVSTPPSINEMRSALSQKLRDYMIPSTFVILDQFPKLPGGKVDRKALPRPIQGRSELMPPFVPPRSVTEQVLADIWAQVLHVDRVGRDDDFLDLGGDSLLATALLVHVEESFKKQLPLAALIEASTVAQMATILRHERWSSPDSCLVTIQSNGDKPPFFCIHGIGGHALGFAALSRRLGEDQPFFALESAGRDGEQRPLATIEAMAQRYISDIMAVQPDGPYFLGGFSMGGVIAFEMAQQLQAHGREVGLLALFDPDCHGLTGAWRRWSHTLLREIRNSPKLLHLNPTTNRRVLKEKFETVASTVISSSPVEKPNRHALSRYRPNPYPGKITFFWATDRPEDPSDPRWGWRQVANGGLEIHRIPGDHLSILREPQLQFLSEQLKICLENSYST